MGYLWLRSLSTFQGKLYSVQVDPNEMPGIESKFANEPVVLPPHYESVRDEILRQIERRQPS